MRSLPPRPGLISAGALLTTLLTAATTARAAEPPGEPRIAVESYTLPNGLKVLLHADARQPIVTVNVWYDVGGLHERTGKTGFAHLFEHMMFQGSLHVPEDQHFPLLQKAGASDVNGTTDFDRTNYFETVPKNQLETALWLESDRMGFLLEQLNAESLANQIEVVKNERRQSVENTPYGLLEEKIVQAIWPSPHPYFGNVIGSLEDLSAASLDDVKDFWLTYYSPANATLAVGGDFDPATIRATIARYFGTLKGRPKPPPPVFSVASLGKPVRIEHEEPVARLPKVALVWTALPPFAADNAALDLVAYALAGTRSSRLTSKLVHQDELAQAVTARLEERKAGSTFTIEAIARPGRSIDELAAAIDVILKELETRPFTEAELKRAQNAIESRTLFGLESLGSRMDLLQAFNLLLGDPDKLGWDLARYRAVDVAGLNAAARRYLGPNRVLAFARPRATPPSSPAGSRP